MAPQDHAFSPLVDSDLKDAEEKFDQIHERHRKNHLFAHKIWKPLLLQLAVLFLGLLNIGLLGVVLLRKPTDRECAAHTSVWSPLLDVVEYHEFDFEDAFDSRSIYRGPPTAEVEDAWMNLTHKHAVQIPTDKLKYLNRTSADNIKHVPEDVGTGYVALIEVFHQLHCLNLIRQYTWLQSGNYEIPPADLVSTPVGNRMHVDHCIETVRIALMCFSDVTPVLVREDPASPLGSRADFNSHHKCRNFEKIEQWIDNNWEVS